MFVVYVLAYLCVAVSAHSGMYQVNTTKYSKDFSAAWLISKGRFIAAEPSISTAVSMASATFSTIRQRCNNCRTLVTRDFFDFMVEHLSSATNQVPDADPQLFEESSRRLQQTALELKNYGRSNERDPRLDETVGILVYSSICFSKVTQQIQRTIRPSFFVATFWSLHRYVPNIVIYVANKDDADAVNAMELPYARITQLVTPFDSKNRTSLLPRDSMLDLLRSMKSGEDAFYKKFNYVFFSEGDQILHMREPGVMFDTIDNSGGQFIAVPHRMQSLTAAQDFPVHLQSKWPKVHAQNIPDLKIAQLDVHETKGSCCNNGDVEVAPCYGWWYQCTTYGIRDFPTWFKFGATGLTMPPVTEHKATCEYFPDKRQCPLPKGCNQAVPTRSMPHSPLTERDLCGEVVDTRYLGFPPPAPPATLLPPPVIRFGPMSGDLESKLKLTRPHLVPDTPQAPKPVPVLPAFPATNLRSVPKRVEGMQDMQEKVFMRRQPGGGSIAASPDGVDLDNLSRKKRSRLRRRNRRIDSVTITANEKKDGVAGRAAGMRVVTMDDIQIN